MTTRVKRSDPDPATPFYDRSARVRRHNARAYNMTTPPPKRAIFTLVARGDGHSVQPWNAKHEIMPDFHLLARSMLCSYRLWQSAIPMIVLAANISSAAQQDLIRAGGPQTSVLDLSWWDTRALAFYPYRQKQQSWQPDCNNTLRGKPVWSVANRKDMHKTLFKLALWNLTEYDEVAFVDADVTFLTSPDSLFAALTPGDKSNKIGRGILDPSTRPPPYTCYGSEKKSNLTGRPRCASLDFAAGVGIRESCRRYGWQTGFFATRPSKARFASMLRRSKLGDFSLHTHTEQDIIEAEFAAPQCLGRASLPPSPLALLPPSEVGEGGCATTAYLYWAWVASVIKHHRIKGAQRSSELATAVCNVSGLQPPRASQAVRKGKESRGAKRAAWMALQTAKKKLHDQLFSIIQEVQARTKNNPGKKQKLQLHVI